MPWSNQSGGGGWKGGGGGGPWGPRPGPGQQPDLEEILRRSQDRLRQAMPGGRMGGPFAVLHRRGADRGGRLFRLHRARQSRRARHRAAIWQICPPASARSEFPLALPDRAGRAAQGDAHQSHRDRHARLFRRSRRLQHDPRRARREPDDDRRREHRRCRFRRVLADQPMRPTSCSTSRTPKAR